MALHPGEVPPSLTDPIDQALYLAWRIEVLQREIETPAATAEIERLTDAVRELIDGARSQGGG